MPKVSHFLEKESLTSKHGNWAKMQLTGRICHLTVKADQATPKIALMN